MQRIVDSGARRVIKRNESERGSEDSREGCKEPRLRPAALFFPRFPNTPVVARTPRVVGTEADDLENLACEWRGDARTMRGISVLNFARRSWQRVTRPRRVAGCSAAGCNDVWLWLWVVVRVVGISITYLPIRDWDLIYVAPDATAEILCHLVDAECRPGFVTGGEYYVMSTTSLRHCYMCARYLIRRMPC